MAIRMRAVVGGIAVASAVVVVAVGGWWQWTTRSATIEVLPNEIHQTMTGWEVTPRLWEMNKKENRFDASWKPFQAEILERMVNELGINRIRIEFRSGFENPVDYWTQFETGKISYRELGQHWYEAINDNVDPNVANSSGFQFSNLDFQVEQVLIPLRRLVENNGEKLFVNLCFVDFTSPGGNMEHALDPDEYAELTNATFLHLKSKYGVVPDALEIILEPDNTDHWRGPQIGRAMVKARALLQRNGFSPQVIAPSTSKARNAVPYFDAMMQVPGVSDWLNTFSYHRYDNPADATIAGIHKRTAQFHLQTAMLEHLTGDAQELHADLKHGNASAWQMWGLATRTTDPAGVDRSYYYEVNFADPVNPRVRMTARSRGLAQYFKFVRRGATRVGATTDVPWKDPVAFRNSDGTHVVVVNAAHAGAMSIRGLPAGTYGIRYTTEAETVSALAPVPIEAGQALAAFIPAAGVMTIHQTKRWVR